MPFLPYEHVLYTQVPRLTGFFEDLFLLSPKLWQLCHDLDDHLWKEGIQLSHTVFDYFVFEIARIHTGNEIYAGFMRNLHFFNEHAFKLLLNDPTFLPLVQDFTKFFHNIPLEHFYTIFYALLSEFLDLRAITFRILIWDCQFVASNSSNYKVPHTNHYSDRDAKIGRHQNTYLGIGYMISTLYLYCGDLTIPVFYMVFPANISDKEIFSTTMEGYFHRGVPLPYLLLGDVGAYSIQNLRLLAH
jgi:hypothetical protein